MATAAATDGAAGGESGGSFLDNLSLKDITTMIAAIGVIGLILVGAGVAGIVVARKKKASATAAEPAVAGTPRVGRQVAPEQATWTRTATAATCTRRRPAGRWRLRRSAGAGAVRWRLRRRSVGPAAGWRCLRCAAAWARRWWRRWRWRLRRRPAWWWRLRRRA